MLKSIGSILFIGFFLFQSVSFAATAKEIYKNSNNSVVLIISYDKNNTPLALGSGFYISEKRIATNYHVIEDAARIVIKGVSEGMKTEATTIHSFSKRLDLAVIEIKLPGKKLKLKDIQDQAVGDKVISIGNPRGLKGTLSEGIISAMRKVDDFYIYQITTPISPGSSGGPLFDNKGNVIGITTATVSGGQNLNFAVPVILLNRLRSGGKWEPSKDSFPTTPQRGNAGIILRNFSKRNQYETSFSYSLTNTTKNTVKNILYLLLFRDVETGFIIHFSAFMDRDPIPSGLAKRMKKFDQALEGLSTDQKFLWSQELRSFVDGVIDARLRVLSYDIQDDSKRDTVLDTIMKP